jgi:hypothetical protein
VRESKEIPTDAQSSVSAGITIVIFLKNNIKRTNTSTNTERKRFMDTPFDIPFDEEDDETVSVLHGTIRVDQRLCPQALYSFIFKAR